jgi:uncharacterized cupredoxin-like copper-binding protein
MKKMLLVIGMTVACFGAFAQDSTKVRKCFVMEKGQVMAVKDGKEMKMSQDMMLKNGSTVMMDGTVKSKDGTTTILKEGQYVDVNGKMGMMNDMKMEKMKKDSL